MKYDASIYASKDYRRSRMAYMNHCHVEWFVHVLCMEAFLAKLLTTVGMDDAIVGIVSTISRLACAVQLMSFFIVPRIRNTKRYAVPMQIFGEIMFIGLYVIPLLDLRRDVASVLMVVCLALAYFGHMLASTVIFRWGNSFVDPHHRSEFSLTKETISGLLSMGITFGVAYMLDVFDAQGDIRTGFLFTAIAMLIFTLCQMVCLLTIKNEIRTEADPAAPTIREVLQKTLGNKNFRHLVILYSMYQMAIYTTLGFLGTYQLEELGFSVTVVNIFSIIAVCARSICAKAIGRYSDRRSFAKGIELGMAIALISFLVAAITNPGLSWLIVVHAAVYQVSTMGAGSNFVNCLYSYVDSRCFSQAFALLNTIGGVCAFLASLLGSALLDHIQAMGNTFMGVPIYGQQVLSIITVIMIVFCLIYNRLVVEKQQIMIQ